LNDNLLLITTA